MNKKILSLVLALSVLILYRCMDKKPSTSTTVQLANPEFGGFDSQVQWGKHLVAIGGCEHCHTPKKMGAHGPEPDSTLRLSGRPAMMPNIDVDKSAMAQKGYTVTMDLTEWVGPWGTTYAANLTPDVTGTANWTIDNFLLALREGKMKGVPSGRQILPPMPWEDIGKMTDYELKAIFAYLRTVKPVSNTVPQPLPPPAPMAPAKADPKAKKK
ncbi:MAG: c-type cytochrome [Saprospiraceae bacterium]